MPLLFSADFCQGRKYTRDAKFGDSGSMPLVPLLRDPLSHLLVLEFLLVDYVLVSPKVWRNLCSCSKCLLAKKKKEVSNKRSKELILAQKKK